MNILILIFIFGVISLDQNKANGANVNKDCFGIRGDSNSIICRSIPACDENTLKLYRQFNRIVFDLENKNFISSDQFCNCTFSWSPQIDLEFKNIKSISKYAFEFMTVEKNTRLNIKFDGSGLGLDKSNTDKKLLIRKDAFKNVKLKKKSQLIIEITKYKSVLMQDILIDSVLQEETSELSVNIHDCDQLAVKNKNDNENMELDEQESYADDAKSFNINHNSGNDIPLLKSNLSFTFEMQHLDSLRIDPQVFASLQVNPYSGLAVIVKFVHNVYLGNSAFDSLMLGTYAQFNFLIESVGSISLGKSLFNALQQEQTSVFYFQLDQIGTSYTPSAAKAKRDVDAAQNDEYYDYSGEYDDKAEYDASQAPLLSSYTNWLCIPEGLFKNVQQYESGLAQVHFTNIYSSISVSALAFNELQLSENSKFQILFEDIKGHVVFDKDAVNLVKLSDGIFEIWIENHMQQELIRGNQSPSEKNKSKAARFPADTFKLMKSVKNSYFKLADYAINQVFLTPRSEFRIGYIGSDSVLLVKPKSLNGFHVDRFDAISKKSSKSDELRDYRTKLTFKIDDSDNVRFDFSSLNSKYEDETEKNANLPKIIEIDGYEPSLSAVKADGSLDSAPAQLDSKSKSSLGPIKSDSYLKKEFCKFYKLKQFMSSITKSKSTPVYKLTNNLIYFLKSMKNNGVDGDSSSSPSMCSSCLFIYLYRVIQRRTDFYFVKDHLPNCFINLHFKNSLYFQSSKDSGEKHQYISNIEDNFKYYWKLLRCKAITGLGPILDYDSDVNEIDETQSDYDAIERHCKDEAKFDDEIKAVADFDDNNWHDNSLKICTKNIIDSKSNRTSVQLSLRKNTISSNKRKSDVLRNKIISGRTRASVFFIVAAVVLSSIFIVFVYVKYRKPQRPCIRLSFRRDIKSFQRLSNANLSTRSVNNSTSPNKKSADDNDEDGEDGEQGYDELNGYEYDDEFEMNDNGNVDPEDGAHKAQSKLQTACTSSNENIEFKMEPGSILSSSKFGELKNKSLQRIKSLKSSLFNKDMLKNSLLNVTNVNHPHFKQSKAGQNSKFPHYSYNSTDSTLVQTKVQNEFEITDKGEDKNLELEEDLTYELNTELDGKSSSVVTYDLARNKSKQNVVKNNYNLLLAKSDGCEQKEENVMRLKTNPLDNLDMEVITNDDFDQTVTSNKNSESNA
jgi:hypothetical protein